MPKLKDHPTVQKMSAMAQKIEQKEVLDSAWLRELMLEAGADDVGFVSIDRPEIDDQRDDIFALFPAAKTLIPYVVRMNREPIRTPMRSVSNLEFHHTGDLVTEIGHEVVRRLEDAGIRALNPSMGFPMEVQRFPDAKMWVISHKPVAVAGGLGHMGIHRNVIHPQYGNFVLLGTILLAADVTEETHAIDYNPCLECKLCVAACPVGAIGADGWFDFNACYTHNYREFLGGFKGWVDTVADSKNSQQYAQSFTAGETTSMWQSLAFGPNYKAAYCMAVCPAGEDVIAPYLADKSGFLNEFVKPLQNKEETIYVSKNSDAAEHVKKRFPHKTVKEVNNGISVSSVPIFIDNLKHFFQRHKSEGLNATYHFVFTGETQTDLTVTIANKTITTQEGLHGKADITIHADSVAWVRFLQRKMTGVFAVMRRKIRIDGDPRLLIAFGNCFPF